MRRERPHTVKCYHGSGGDNEGAFLYYVGLNKVCGTKDYLNRQTCKGILCVSAQSPHKSSKDSCDIALFTQSAC